jgi:hypothetical protein
VFATKPSEVELRWIPTAGPTKYFFHSSVHSTSGIKLVLVIACDVTRESEVNLLRGRKFIFYSSNARREKGIFLLGKVRLPYKTTYFLWKLNS